MGQIHRGDTHTSRGDGIFVISLWDPDASTFLARLTMSDADGEASTVIVRNPEGVLASLREWLRQQS